METRAQAELLSRFNPEQRQAIKELGESLRPTLDKIHARVPSTRNYYGDYMAILSERPEYAKIMALAMLYAGANPQGIQDAVKFVN